MQFDLSEVQLVILMVFSLVIINRLPHRKVQICVVSTWKAYSIFSPKRSEKQ